MVAEKRHASIRRAGRPKLNTRSTYKHVDVSREKVSENEDARRTRLESPHEQVPPLLVEHGTQGRDFPCCWECSSIFLLKTALRLGTLFQFFSSIPCGGVYSFISFRLNVPAVGNALLFPLCSTTSGRIDAFRSCCDLLIHRRNCTDLGRSWCDALHH